MRILNIMLGKGKGGLEKAFCDATHLLSLKDHQVLSVFQKEAWIAPMMQEAPGDKACVKSAAAWDPRTAWQLKRILKSFQPDAILCHGNRAFHVALKAAQGLTPVVVVAHTPWPKRFEEASGVIAVSKGIQHLLAKKGIHTPHVVPNTVRLPKISPPIQHNPIHLGAMGRLVEEKGFQVFLEALSTLKAQAIPFHAIVAGEGPYAPTLKEKSASLHLQDHVTFTGWMAPQDFYHAIDLFILPSLVEPFGIVILEAMAHGVPVVATDCDGPTDIFKDFPQDFLLPCGDATALTQRLKHLMTHKIDRENLQMTQEKLLQSTYVPEVVAAQLDAALREILKK